MRSSSVERSSFRHIALATISVTACLVVSLLVSNKALANDGGTTLRAIVCGQSSSVTIARPVSDTVVTQREITIEGIVKQAVQLEIQVDGKLDTVSPLDVGQTQFSQTVSIPLGTHTITVVAVNACPGTNGSASTVVTFERPPNTPSTGSQTTGVLSQDQRLKYINETGDTSPLERVAGLSKEFAAWMNIGLAADKSDGLKRMTPVQALSLTTGLVMVFIIGFQSTVQSILGFRLFSRNHHALTPAVFHHRVRLWVWRIRIGGLLLVVASLFL